MGEAKPSPVERINAMAPADFAAALGAIYEHAPWVAARAANARPFASMRALHEAMLRRVNEAADEEKLALIRAHPELAGQEAAAGTLTPASATEQGRLGFDRLDRASYDALAALNRRYRETFGFPCIVALRLHDSRDGVMAAIERRLGRGRGEEIATALEQIGEIARGRLARLCGVEAGRLTTHVLDTASGVPAAAMGYELAVWQGGAWQRVASGLTNAQGRTDRPLLADIDLEPGRYRLAFAVGAYFRARGAALSEPAFLDVVPLDFGLAAADQHYHVPLLCSPWSYSTYRGS